MTNNLKNSDIKNFISLDTFNDTTLFAISVVNLETFELLYVNDSMKEILADSSAKKCWEAKYGQESKCMWCKADTLLSGTDNDKVTYENFNEVNDNWYQVQERISVLEDGTKILISFLIDISEQKKSQSQLINSHVKLRSQQQALKEAKEKIEETQAQLNSSIEYSSIIQSAFIPENDLFEKYFDDFFTLWQPRDTVGGDIFLFDELRNDNECILMVIDCTGHGVPGAFITMIVKAIERQVITELNISGTEVNPANILKYFNYHLKHILKQDKTDAASNAGFDGAILYYNKETNIVKFAGANTPLFYVQGNKLNVIKGDKQSIGYRKSNVDFEFTEHIIEINNKTNIYITTDGYLDQNGGEKDFPFGKRKFKNIIEESHNKNMSVQKETFLNILHSYMNECPNTINTYNDDITIIGLEIKG